MSNDFIPTKAPNDSIQASRSEVKKVLDWTETVFGDSEQSADTSIRINVRRQDFNTLHYRQSCMGNKIKIGQREFERGLGTHATSEIAVHIPFGAKKFKSFVGVDNNSSTGGINGSVWFAVEAGGNQLAKTGVRKGSDEAIPIDVDLPAGATELVLRVDMTDDGPAFDQSDWADACFVMVDGSVRYLDEVQDYSLLSDTRVPFSFKYNGVASSDLLPKWKRTAEKKDEADRVKYLTNWTDPETGLVVTADVTAFKEYPAVEWLLHFANNGSKDTPILEDLQTIDMGLATHEAASPVVIHQLHGDSCSDMTFVPFDTKLGPGNNTVIAAAGGRPSQGIFPFWNLQFKNDGIITAIGWSGQWSALYDRTTEGTTRFSAGMEKTHLLLHPGETIRTPRVLMMTWGGDKQAAQNRFRRLMLFKYVPQENGRPLRLPICLQTFDRYISTPGWATESGQLEAVKAAHGLGCDTYWFDAGWFEGGFPGGAGNWYYKAKEFPNGLKPVGYLCKQFDMDFVLWFEPCRVAPGTLIAREHPEWVLGGAQGGLFNLGDPDGLRWLTDLLAKRVGESGVTVYREDYNIDPLDFWRKNDAPDRQGMTEIRFVEGHYAMWDALRQRYPGLWIDNCASGGRRIDLETCMRSVPLWRSDTCCWAGHPEWNQMQAVALSQFVPLNTAAAWDPDSYTFRSAATAGLLCQLAYRDPKFPKQKAIQMLNEVRENRKYWYGDFYPMTAVTTNLDEIYAYQLHRADLNEGIIMGFRRPECNNLGLIVAPHGLKAGTTYSVEFIDNDRKKTVKQMTSKQMMTNGVELRFSKPGTSMIIRYKPASK